MIGLHSTIQTRNSHNSASSNEHNEKKSFEISDTQKKTGDELNISREERMKDDPIISV